MIQTCLGFDSLHFENCLEFAFCNLGFSKFIWSGFALSDNRSIHQRWNTYSDAHSLIFQKSCIFPALWHLQRCRWTFFPFCSSWSQSCSSRPPDPRNKYSIKHGGKYLLHSIISPFLKAESVPILPATYIFNYFLNECSGLAEIKAGPIFAGGLKPVKSLTIAVLRHESG